MPASFHGKSSSVFLLLLLVLQLAFTQRSDAQSSPSYGPPAIALAGSFYAYSNTGTDPTSGLACDFYNGPNGAQIAVDRNDNVTVLAGAFLSYTATYDPSGTAFYDSTTGQLSTSFAAVSADGSNFLGLPVGITVRSNYAIGSMSMYDTSGNLSWSFPAYSYAFTTGGNTIYVAKFMNLAAPFLFQVDASPMYSYSAGNASSEVVLDQTSGTWQPPSNLFSTPPPTVYTLVSGDASSTAYSLGPITYLPGPTFYEQQLTYYDSNGNYGVSLQLYYNFSGAPTGAIVGDADGSVYFTGSYDPVALQFSNISDPTVQVSLSPISPSGGTGGGGGTPPPARQGPLYISWDGTLLTYQSTDSSGNDYYTGTPNSVTVTINNGSSVSGYNPSYAYGNGNISGTYNTATSTFTVPDSNFFALDIAGNPIGLPFGLTMLFPSTGIGQSVTLSNNQSTLQA